MNGPFMIKILVCNAQNHHGMESSLKRKTRKTTPKMQTQRILKNVQSGHQKL